MFKYVLVLIALVVGLAYFAKPVQAETTIQLDQNGCAAVANVMGGMVANRHNGQEFLYGIATEDEFNAADPQIREHVKLLQAMINKYPTIDPVTFAESYFGFCLGAEGNVAAMNAWMANELRVQSL